MHLTKRRRVWGVSMEDFGLLWVWGFRGDSHGFFVDMGWVWGLKSNPHGSPVNVTTCSGILFQIRGAAELKARLENTVLSAGWESRWQSDDRN